MVQKELESLRSVGVTMPRDAARAGPRAIPRALAETKLAIPDVRFSML